MGFSILRDSSSAVLVVSVLTALSCFSKDTCSTNFPDVETALRMQAPSNAWKVP